MNEQKIDNSKLEEAMQVFIEEKTHEHMLEVMKNIRLARVFVPTTLPDNVDVEQIKAASNGEQVPMPKGAKFSPCIIKNTRDEKFFPIFTSQDQVPQDQKYPAIINIPFLDCAVAASKDKNLLKGIAINPFKENVLFQQELLEAMLKAEKELKGKKIVPISKEQYHLMVRRQIEHMVLPKTLHTRGAEFVNALEQDREELLCNIYTKPYDKKVAAPYSMDDFSIMPLNINEDLEVIRIDLPQKNLAVGICARVYMTFNPQNGDTGYFMIEGGKEKGSFLMNEVSKDGKKSNIGEAPGEGMELQSVIELVKSRRAEAQMSEN